MEYFSIISKTIQSGLSDFGSMHPLIVHFPIALLFTAPVFLILAIVLNKNRTPFLYATLILITLGTLSVWKSTWSGELATESITVELSDGALEALTNHDELAHTTKSIYFSLLAVFVAYMLSLKWSLQKFSRQTHTAFLAIYTLIFCAGLIVLINAAHYGGELVHKHNIKTSLFNDPMH